jgi:hypothetical protein
MLRAALTIFVFSLASIMVYKEWATYPRLIPNQRDQRYIASMARRRGISLESAYVRWANQRLRWTRYRHLARDV